MLAGHVKVGYALFFYTYSTWKGRCVYLEDLYVMPELRGKQLPSPALHHIKPPHVCVHVCGFVCSARVEKVNVLPLSQVKGLERH